MAAVIVSDEFVHGIHAGILAPGRYLSSTTESLESQYVPGRTGSPAARGRQTRRGLYRTKRGWTEGEPALCSSWPLKCHFSYWPQRKRKREREGEKGEDHFPSKTSFRLTLISDAAYPRSSRRNPWKSPDITGETTTDTRERKHLCDAINCGLTDTTLVRMDARRIWDWSEVVFPR